MPLGIATVARASVGIDAKLIGITAAGIADGAAGTVRLMLDEVVLVAARLGVGVAIGSVEQF